jgi:hypothetical protein
LRVVEASELFLRETVASGGGGGSELSTGDGVADGGTEDGGGRRDANGSGGVFFMSTGSDGRAAGKGATTGAAMPMSVRLAGGNSLAPPVGLSVRSPAPPARMPSGRVVAVWRGTPADVPFGIGKGVLEAAGRGRSLESVARVPDGAACGGALVTARGGVLDVGRGGPLAGRGGSLAGFAVADAAATG